MSGSVVQDVVSNAPGEGKGPDVAARVYVIDDDGEIRRSLHYLLSSAQMVSWPFASSADFLDNLPSLTPSPILLDMRMPEMDGIQLLHVLRDRGFKWPIIMMTAHGEIQTAVKAIKLGAMEFIEKPFEFEMLHSALQNAFALLESVTAEEKARKAARRRLDLLTPREAEVLALLMRGIPNKICAHILSLSVRTVEMHRANILGKLNVKSLAEVARLTNDADLSLQ